MLLTKYFELYFFQVRSDLKKALEEKVIQKVLETKKVNEILQRTSSLVTQQKKKFYSDIKHHSKQAKVDWILLFYKNLCGNFKYQEIWKTYY